MSYTWEVLAWQVIGDNGRDDPDLGYVTVYHGESMVAAIRAARRAKRAGAGCVTIHWR